MPQQKKCLGVDIGATSVKIAEIVYDKAGVRITRLVSAEIGLLPGPMDAERAAVVARTVREMAKEHKFTSRQAVFSIPGQNVFIRRIRVPRTTDERLHLIVSYEAKQQIPFALDNALVEYQVIDVGDSGEVEVLLVAVKRDLVTEFMKLVDKTGLKPLMISVSSLALFNFHVFDSTPLESLLDEIEPRRRKPAAGADADAAGDEPAPKKKGGFNLDFLKSLGKKKPAKDEPVEMATEDDVLPEYDVYVPDGFEEVRAYVNIGATMFDLAIGRLGERRLLGFTRSVPWAGNELSRVLMDKMSLDSFQSVDSVKKAKASVVIPGMEEQVAADGYDPDVSEFTTTWADRLILDLRKSFDYYISQPDGMAVDKIALSGLQSLIPNLPLYMEDKLGIPVELRAEPENDTLKVPMVDGPGGLTQYLIAMGLALTGVGLGRVSVDFLPGELKTLREFKKKNIPVGVMAASIVVMLLLGMRAGEGRIGTMSAWLSENQERIPKLQADSARISQAEQARAKVADKLNAIGDAIGDRGFWLEFLGVIEGLKPSKVVVSKVSLLPDGVVSVDFEAEPDFTGIGGFTRALKEEPVAKEWIDSASVSAGQAFQAASVLQPGRQIQRFNVLMRVHWKETRLAPARATLAPGLTAPTPTPEATPGGMMPGMMIPGMPDGGMPLI